MRRRVSRWHSLGIALILLLCPVAVLVARAAALNEVVDRWCSAQTNIQSWSADLVQTRSLKVLTQPLLTAGKVWVVTPNRFRWELGQPAQTIAVRQPDWLWLMYPRLKRAEKYPLNAAQPGPWKEALALLDASFPKNRAELDSHFQVLSMSQTNDQVNLVLQPKNADARKFMTEILISFHTNNYSPAATELKFSDGSRMRNDFTNSVMNPALSNEMFEVKLPPEYTVVEPMRP